MTTAATPTPHTTATIPEGVVLGNLSPEKHREIILEVMKEYTTEQQRQNPMFGMPLTVMKDPNDAARERRKKCNEWVRAMWLERNDQKVQDLSRDLGTTPSSAGGYTVPTLVSSDVMIKEENISKFESYCRRWPMGSQTIQINQISTKPTAVWRNRTGNPGEGGAIGKSNPAFGAPVTLNSHPLDLYSAMSRELLQDSNVDIFEIVVSLLVEARVLASQAAYAVGDADGQPKGLNSAGIATVATLSAAIGYSNLRKLFYRVQAPYRDRAVWVMNSGAISAIADILATTGTPIFKDPTDSQPPKVFGRPIVELPDVAGSGDGSSNGTTIYFLDLMVCYALGLRTALEVEPNTQSDLAFLNHQVLVKATGRLDGKPNLINTANSGKLANVYA